MVDFYIAIWQTCFPNRSCRQTRWILRPLKKQYISLGKLMKVNSDFYSEGDFDSLFLIFLSKPWIIWRINQLKRWSLTCTFSRIDHYVQQNNWIPQLFIDPILDRQTSISTKGRKLKTLCRKTNLTVANCDSFQKVSIECRITHFVYNRKSEFHKA